MRDTDKKLHKPAKKSSSMRDVKKQRSKNVEKQIQSLHLHSLVARHNKIYKQGGYVSGHNPHR